MKKILLIISIIILGVNFTYAQREKVNNIPDFDAKKWHWGYFLGINYYDFNIDPSSAGMIENRLAMDVNSSPGLNVGLIGDYKLNENVNLRFEPGLNYSHRTLIYEPGIVASNDTIREINSTYIDLPFYAKIGGKRRKNIRPYAIGGLKLSFDLASKSNSSEDNNAGVFRMKPISFFWDAGAGIDWYLPYFKLSTEIRGSFSMFNEMLEDGNPPGSETTPYTNSIDNLRSRAIFFVLKFE